MSKINETLYNIHIEQLIKDCMSFEFPGTQKWDKNNPIWDCNVYNKVSPKEAWKNYDLMYKAAENLFYIIQKSIKENKYPNFISKIKLAFEKAYSEGDFSLLNIALLQRFTIAKIAPKVTALKSTDFLRILKESNIDITNGIYCPMSGFGGIVEGAKKWFNKNGLSANIEAYDINPNFCKYYGWIQRDVLAQKIKTDKIVFACPPFGNKTERWKGTPDNMYYDFHTWCKLIKEYIKAPNYILIGPEISSNKNSCGLFNKKYGIQYYPEYSII